MIAVVQAELIRAKCRVNRSDSIVSVSVSVVLLSALFVLGVFIDWWWLVCPLCLCVFYDIYAITFR